MGGVAVERAVAAEVVTVQVVRPEAVIVVNNRGRAECQSSRGASPGGSRDASRGGSRGASRGGSRDASRKGKGVSKPMCRNCGRFVPQPVPLLYAKGTPTRVRFMPAGVFNSSQAICCGYATRTSSARTARGGTWYCLGILRSHIPYISLENRTYTERSAM